MFASNMQTKGINKYIVSIAVVAAAMLVPFQGSAQKKDTVATQSKDTLNLSASQVRKAERIKKRELRDSIRNATPLILETYILPDSLKYKRVITWKHNSHFNSITRLNPDTTYNENFYDLPFFRSDVGATYLGVAGSATQTLNYFLRDENRVFKPASLYSVYSYTPENLPFYNVKTPVTELVYAGTLLANRQTEESNVRFMHTQNISPNFNFMVMHKRYGAKGLLLNEKTDNRTFVLAANYLGKKYIMHGGYIYQGVRRSENGGVADDGQILDTIADPRTLVVNLEKASNVYKRNTIFLTQSYGMRLIKSRDTSAAAKDLGTIAYLGHSGEYTTYRRVYIDDVTPSDELGAAFYDNKFNISETGSYDSTRVASFENKLFIRLQPWSSEAIISNLDGGVGYRMISLFGNRPEFDSIPEVNKHYNNLYLYAGASGKFRKYFGWEGFGQYNLGGCFANDFKINGKVRFSLYPIREGIHLTGEISISKSTPDWFDNYTYTNHYSWTNNFSKTDKSRVEATLDIPAFKFKAFVGYELINNKIFYDTKGIVRQYGDAVNILSGYLQKDIKLGILHMNNRVLAQVSSNDSIVPLPSLSANLRYFLEFDLVKGVLRGQFGADATWNTKYYSPAYNPALNVFHNQNEKKIGNTPYIDLFVNLQWKRASIFVKYENAFQGWPNADYFSALHYIKPQTAVKFGIHWPFYVK